MSKVVPFSRSAAYLHQRAEKNRREGHLLDALELTRRALEKDPDNVKYELDQAQVLCELGCFTQSNRVLSRMLSQNASLAECYFGMACNFFGMNDADSAYKALMCFLAEDPEAANREEVGELLHNLFVARTLSNQKSRRKARASKLAGKGLGLLRSGETKESETLLRRSLQVMPRQSETRALLAMNLLMKKDQDGAVREISRALRVKKPPMRTMCIAAQVFHRVGNDEAALKILDRAAERNPDGAHLRMLLDAACDLKADERVYELSTRALRETPYDQMLLHRCAAAIVNTHRPMERATHCWARIRRIQPSDEVASYYLSHAEAGPISYQYGLPDSEIRERAAYFSKIAKSGLEGIRAAWAESPKLIRMTRWAIESGDPAFMRAAVGLLSAVEAPEVLLLLRQIMIEPSVPQALRHQALSVLGARNAQPPFLMLGEDKFILSSASDSGELPRLPLAYRRVLKRAVYTGMSIKEDYPARLTMLWLRFTNALGAPLPLLKDLNSWAAALNLIVSRRDNPESDADELAEMFHCSRRKMEYMAHRIERLAPLPPKEKEEPDETH